MRVLALSDVPLDSPRAHAINVIKTAGGFLRGGHEVLLCARAPRHASAQEALASLGEERLAVSLTHETIPSEQDGGVAFGHEVARIAQELRPDLVYARHFHGALACASLGLRTVMETHAYRGDPNPALLASLKATRSIGLTIVTISHRLREDYIQRGADPARVHIVPDGVDTDLFARPDDIGPTPLGDGPPAVLYAGHLYDAKGIPTMLEAAGLAGRSAWALHLVGGLDEDIARTAEIVRERGLDHVVIHGRVAHVRVPPYLWHASVLLLTPSAREASKDWTSPVKLGEYLASQTPVVCSDIPALRDWIPRDLVEWCEPDDPQSLADAIGRTLDLCDEIRADRACRALALAHRLSYRSRARAIVRCATGERPALRIGA